MRGIRESSNSETSSRSSGLRQFSLTSFREAQRIVVRACGRLIVGRGADQDLVDETTATNVALDLSCVNDVDARGLGLIAGLVNRARGRGTIVSVMAASRVVQRLAEMTMIRASCGQAWLAALDDFRNWLIRAERV
jgi:ABC-type transporter Mla MlaB component